MPNKTRAFLLQRNDIFYFVRRIPDQLQHHYRTGRICFSLKTKSKNIALLRSRELASRLETYWFHLRMREDAVFGRFLNQPIFTPLAENAVKLDKAVGQSKDAALKFSEARKLYLRLKGQNRTPNFYRATERDCNILINLCGDKPISEYLRTDATALRDHLLSENMAGQSIVRILSTIKAILNFAATESGIPNNSSFTGLYIDRSLGRTDRQPISLENIRILQEKCFRMNDERRWLVALVSDTGIRLAEGVGLRKSDFQIMDGIPVVVIKTHPWRRLKTKSSERIIPLVGWSLWARDQILRSENRSDFAFPCYNKTKLSNSNSASAALNKWLETQVPGCGTIHGFRHSGRDRLRAVECPSDIVDQIGGWTSSGVGHSYGQGYPLAVLHKWMLKITEPK
jgi:integrase